MATYRTVFSIANIIVATAVTHAAAGLVGGLTVRDDWTALVVPTLAGATAFFFCNTLMLAQAVALESKKSPAVLWREQFLWSAPACFVGAIVGVSAAYLIETASRLAAFVAIPVVLFYWGYRTYLGFIEKQETMHLATVEALARAIGARDQTLEASKTVSDTHVRRVQRLAVTLARRAGMSDDEVKGVEVAALLHDIGKLAVPEHILNKPTKLTTEERKLIQMHPTVGAEIIGAVDFGYPVAPLIASHHERWNGEGYPKGLRAEEIPLGSRILGIVDYFDALIADRPYHKAKPEAEARLIIKEEGGSALDPTLVEMFLTILEEEMPLTNAVAVPGERAAQPVAPQPEGQPTPAAIDNVLENIARANTEMGALYGLTEAMGSRLSVTDTMALIALRLSPLVPASAWALFVCDETTGVSRCTFAAGLDSERLQQLEVPAGRRRGRLSGAAGQDRAQRPSGGRFPRRRACPTPESSLQSMVAVPAARPRPHHRRAGRLSRDRQLLHRGARGHAREDRAQGRHRRARRAGVREGAHRVADRSAHRPAQLARAARPRRKGDVEGRPLSHRAGDAGHRRRSLQGDQRPVRPPGRRPRAAVHRPRDPRVGARLRLLRPPGRRRVHRRAAGVRRDAGARARRRTAGGRERHPVRAGARRGGDAVDQRRPRDVSVRRRLVRGAHPPRRRAHVRDKSARKRRGMPGMPVPTPVER